MSTTESPSTRPLRFGRFVIIDEAGAGAMGTVYAAYDPTLDRRIALKVLRSQTADRQQDRIRREALAMARVSHRNVVQVYDVGEHESRLFIAMEFVEGVTLSAWQAEARPWIEVSRMYAEIARGLAAAHAAGLVHRDFKPDNVLVDGHGRPRIIDFGLARATALDDAALNGAEGEEPDGEEPESAGALAEAPGDPDEPGADGAVDGSPGMTRSGGPSLVGSNDLLAHSLTRTGHVMGTPAYMAPELMARQPPTPRSDQFAFTVAFYEGLCGQPPFPRDSLIGLKLAVTRGDVRPPPADREVPGPLARILLRALSPDPDGRFASIDDLIAALDGLIADDELIDWRPRIVVFALIAAGLLAAVLTRRSGDVPETATDMIYTELVLGSFVLLALLPFRRIFQASVLHRRALIWLVLMTPAKMVMPVVGLVYGVEPAVIRAFDTVLVATMSAVVVYLIYRPIWPALVVALLCLVGLLVEPAWNGPLHGTATISLALVVVSRALLAARRARRSPVLGPDQKSA